MIANHRYGANVGCQLLFIPRSAIFLLFLAGFMPANRITAFEVETARKLPSVYVFLNTECPISQQYARRLSVLSHQYASSVRFVALFPSKTDTPVSFGNSGPTVGWCSAASRMWARNWPANFAPASRLKWFCWIRRAEFATGVLSTTGTLFSANIAPMLLNTIFIMPSTR